MKFKWQSKNGTDLELVLGDDVIGGIKPVADVARATVGFQTWTVWPSANMTCLTLDDAKGSLWYGVAKRYRMISDEAARQRDGVRPKP